MFGSAVWAAAHYLDASLESSTVAVAQIAVHPVQVYREWQGSILAADDVGAWLFQAASSFPRFAQRTGSTAPDGGEIQPLWAFSSCKRRSCSLLDPLLGPSNLDAAAEGKRRDWLHTPPCRDAACSIVPTHWRVACEVTGDSWVFFASTRHCNPAKEGSGLLISSPGNAHFALPAACTNVGRLLQGRHSPGDDHNHHTQTRTASAPHQGLTAASAA
jgi:hypothetical protein